MTNLSRRRGAMSPIKYPERRNRASGRASACPKCGYPLSQTSAAQEQRGKTPIPPAGFEDSVGVCEKEGKPPALGSHVAAGYRISKDEMPDTLRFVSSDDENVHLECVSCGKFYSFKRDYFDEITEDGCTAPVKMQCPACKKRHGESETANCCQDKAIALLEKPQSRFNREDVGCLAGCAGVFGFLLTFILVKVFVFPSFLPYLILLIASFAGIRYCLHSFSETETPAVCPDAEKESTEIAELKRGTPFDLSQSVEEYLSLEDRGSASILHGIEVSKGLIRDSASQKYQSFSYGLTGWLAKSGSLEADGEWGAFACVEVPDMPEMQSDIRCYGHASFRLLDSDHRLTLFRIKSLEDAIAFRDFHLCRNNLVETMADKAISKCQQIARSAHQGQVSSAVTNYIAEFPDAAFTMPAAYFALILKLREKDRLLEIATAKYGTGLAEEAYCINQQNELLFDKMAEMYDALCQLIEEEAEVNSKLLPLVTFNMLNISLASAHKQKWLEHIEFDMEFGDFTSYVERAVNLGKVDVEDNEVLAELTYYLMDFPPCSQLDYGRAFKKVRSEVGEASRRMRNMLYRNQLLGKNAAEGQARAISLDDIDSMSGDEFEHVVCKLFQAMGYSARVTKQSGDQGIDVVAKRGIETIGIQAKCYSSTVGNSAVQEAVAGRAYYGCNKSMVITNSTFTSSAVNLAFSNDVVLWDRDMLGKKLSEHPVYP